MTAPDAAGPGAPPGLQFDSDGVPDFTIRREPHRFRVDNDVFTAPPLIGGFMMRKLAVMHSELGDITALVGQDDAAIDKVITLMAEMFKALMPGPDGKLFAARLMSDGDPGDAEADPPRPASPAPIGLMNQAMPILYWLLEQYGLRPTVPSSPSPTGSMDGATDIPSVGTSSTDGVSLEDSTTSDSQPATGSI